MAHGQSLVLREIRSHSRASAHKENGWRRHSTAQAKAARVSRRRWLRSDRRKTRGAA